MHCFSIRLTAFGELMDILLAGGTSHFLKLLVDKLNKEGHRVFQLTEEPKTEKKLPKVFETYHFPYDDTCISDVIGSIQPDVTVFLGAFDTNFKWDKAQSRPAVYTAGVFNILMAQNALGKGRFIYLSSEEVFQGEYAGEINCDDSCAVYTDKGQAVSAGEEICKTYRQMGKDVVVLRLDHLYGIPKNVAEAKNLVARMIIEALETGEIQADDNQRMQLLYYADAVEFVYQVIKAKRTNFGLYQISTGKTVMQREIAELIAHVLGSITLVKAPKEQRLEPVLSNERFAGEFGIRIMHDIDRHMEELAGKISKNAEEYVRVDNRKQTFMQRMGTRTRQLITAMVPFIENLGGFVLFFLLNKLTSASPYFQNVDFYLLYVMIFALMFGQQQAIFSCVLAVAGYYTEQLGLRDGFSVIIDFHTYIWIAQLLILGLLAGFLRDQLNVLEEEQKHEVNYLSKQIDDISDINVSNVRVKEILSSQIVNQNDSFGKLYEITSSLDKLEPNEVLFYAAEVLARLMGSRDVAVYSVANRSYARLFSATSPKARCLGNSINYAAMGELYDRLLEKKVYINKNMNENYPLMADAIYSEDEMQLILMVWGIPWERMTLGQANMLTVIGYLIQNAVLRANRYMSALESQRYIGGTNILETEAFRSLVTAYLRARQKGLTECALIEVDLGTVSLEEAGQKLSAKMRQSDFLGELKKGTLYALLANTNSKDAAMVQIRFEEMGFACRIQEEISL